MKWWNLRSNRCPKCGADLRAAEGELIINCEDPECDFKISTKKFESITSDQNTRDLSDRVHEEEDNQEALNNL